jgi:hypothetical protein
VVLDVRRELAFRAEDLRLLSKVGGQLVKLASG